jgi:hypothetical protein
MHLLPCAYRVSGKTHKKQATRTALVGGELESWDTYFPTNPFVVFACYIVWLFHLFNKLRISKIPLQKFQSNFIFLSMYSILNVCWI